MLRAQLSALRWVGHEDRAGAALAVRLFCLCEAPSAEAAEAVHREAHGLVADEIVEVKEGS